MKTAIIALIFAAFAAVEIYGGLLPIDLSSNKCVNACVSALVLCQEKVCLAVGLPAPVGPLDIGCANLFQTISQTICAGLCVPGIPALPIVPAL